jgi:hypothetical protein
MIRRCVLLTRARICASKGSAGSLGPSRTGVFARADRFALATTFSSSVFAKTIRHSTPAFLRAVSYNRNRSTPRARSRFRDDNCAANARLSPIRDQNIFPNRDALPQGEGHKNKFLPNAPRPWHPRAPAACRTSTRRPRLTRYPGCDPRLPLPTRPHIRISPGLSPNNAFQNLHAARPPVIPSAVEESLAT